MKQNNMILGIKGRRRTGKTTVAQLLMDHFCSSFRQCKMIGFADSIKDDIAKYTGGDVETINKNKEILRPILQKWGDFYRNGGHFIDIVEKELKLMEAPFLFIIHDVRFIDEAKAIKKWGGIIIGVERSYLICDKKIDLHPSETEADQITPDLPVCNDGSLEELKHHGMLQVIEWLNRCLS
jgi:hypothetical protein